MFMNSPNRVAETMNTVFAQRLQYLYSVVDLGKPLPSLRTDWYVSPLDILSPLIFSWIVSRAVPVWLIDFSSTKQLTNHYGSKTMLAFQVRRATQRQQIWWLKLPHSWHLKILSKCKTASSNTAFIYIHFMPICPGSIYIGCGKVYIHSTAFDASLMISAIS